VGNYRNVTIRDKQHHVSRGISVGTRLYIKNLNPETTENDVYDLFAGVGRVSMISLSGSHVAGASKNYCVIDMETAELAREAVRKVNGRLLNGFKLEVSDRRSPDLRSSPM
jgi:RNA recognition motif-containing protein